MERSSLKRDEVAQALRGTDHFLTVPHVSPDPDTLGAAIGLAILLGRLGKTAWVYAPEPLPFDARFLEELAPIIRTRPPGGPWHAIVLDCGDPRRLPPDAKLDGVWLNIDHHLDNAYFATHTWVDAAAASTTEMVADLVEALGVPLDPASATALYAGMLYDTRGFVSAQTRGATHRLAAKLVDAGASPRHIHRALNEQIRPEALRVMGQALATLRVECGGELVWTVITREMMLSSLAHEDETDLILSELPRIAPAEVMILFKELADGSVKVSLRSRGKADIHAIAKAFGGGGHQLAAGLRVVAPVAEVVAPILEAARRALGLERPAQAL